MFKTLIIPDIHQQITKLMAIEAAVGDVDQIAYLGDFSDSYKYTPESMQATLDFIAERLEDPKRRWLPGNHDMMYLYSQYQDVLCSGYQYATSFMWNKIRDKFIEHMEFFVEIDGYTLSHAGFAEDLHFLQKQSSLGFDLNSWLKYHLKNRTSATQHIFQYGYLRVGESRGGWAKTGGITWQDWDEFVDIPGRPQIVGHSSGKEPRQKGESWCIDTGLNHVGFIEDGKFYTKTVEEILCA